MTREGSTYTCDGCKQNCLVTMRTEKPISCLLAFKDSKQTNWEEIK